MSYNQCYHYGRRGIGFGIKNTSGGDESQFMGFIGDQKPEFDSIATEYFRYNEKSGCFGYIAVIDISKENVEDDYGVLKSVFIPAQDEHFTFDNPKSYIRYMYPYYYKNDRENFYEGIKLRQIQPQEVQLSYKQLLEKFDFDGTAGLKRLAKLIETEYRSFFYDTCQRIVIPIDDICFDYSYHNNIYRISAEFCLLMHLLIPECFSGSILSAETLHKSLGYSVCKKTEYKNGVCFVPKSSYIGSSEDVLYDLSKSYDDVPENSFYYELATKAQYSLIEMKNYLRELCSGEDFTANQKNTRSVYLEKLIDLYYIRYDIKELDSSVECVSFKVGKLSERLNRAKKGSFMVEQYCKKYIEHIEKFDPCILSGGKVSEDELLKIWDYALSSNHFSDGEIVRIFDCMDKTYGTDAERLFELKDRISVLEILYGRTENNIIKEHISSLMQKIPIETDELNTMFDTIALYYGNLINKESSCQKEIQTFILHRLQNIYQSCRSFSEKGILFTVAEQHSNVIEISQWEQFVIDTEISRIDIADNNTADIFICHTKQNDYAEYITFLYTALADSFLNQLGEHIRQGNMDIAEYDLQQIRRIQNDLIWTPEKQKRLNQYSEQIEFLKKNRKITQAETFSELTRTVPFSTVREEKIKSFWIKKVTVLLQNGFYTDFRQIQQWKTNNVFSTEHDTQEICTAYDELCTKLDTFIDGIRQQADAGNFERIWWLYSFTDDEEFWKGIVLNAENLKKLYQSYCQFTACSEVEIRRECFQSVCFLYYSAFQKNELLQEDIFAVDDIMLKEFIHCICCECNIVFEGNNVLSCLFLCEQYERLSGKIIYRNLCEWLPDDIQQFTVYEQQYTIAQKIACYQRVRSYIQHNSEVKLTEDYCKAYDVGIFSEGNESEQFRADMIEKARNEYRTKNSYTEKYEVYSFVERNSTIFSINQWQEFVREQETADLYQTDDIKIYLDMLFEDICFHNNYTKFLVCELIHKLIQQLEATGRDSSALDNILTQLERAEVKSLLTPLQKDTVKRYSYMCSILKIDYAQQFKQLQESQPFEKLTNTDLKRKWFAKANAIINDSDYDESTLKYIVQWIVQWKKINKGCYEEGYITLCQKIGEDIEEIKNQFIQGNRTHSAGEILYLWDNVAFWNFIKITDFDFVYDEIFRGTLQNIQGEGLKYSLFLEYSYFRTGIFPADEERYRRNWKIIIQSKQDFDDFYWFIRYLSEKAFDEITAKPEGKREFISLCRWFSQKYQYEQMYRYLNECLGKKVREVIDANTQDSFEQSILIFSSVYNYIQGKEKFRPEKIRYYVSAYIWKDILTAKEKENLRYHLFNDVRKYSPSDIHYIEIQSEMAKVSEWCKENDLNWNDFIRNFDMLDDGVKQKFIEKHKDIICQINTYISNIICTNASSRDNYCVGRPKNSIFDGIKTSFTRSANGKYNVDQPDKPFPKRKTANQKSDK